MKNEVVPDFPNRPYDSIKNGFLNLLHECAPNPDIYPSIIQTRTSTN